ncbi:MAG: hypothetical protein VYD03_07060, partial [Pseudomonadota bacterium]|nr:hypothetical protein [Pseudomonadota bacterium]
MSETTLIRNNTGQPTQPGSVPSLNLQSGDPQEPVAENRSALPFAFARRFGVLLTGGQTSSGSLDAVCKETLPLSVYAEVRRFAKRSVKTRRVTESEFDELLANVYSRDANQAR